MEIKTASMTLNQAKQLVDASICDVKNGFVATGYFLRLIREERLWEKGYSSFQEFLDCNYQKDKSWASRCISLYEQFGAPIGVGELPALAEPYQKYSVSQLIEMVSMSEEQREQVTPEMKVREIRELKPKREKKAKGKAAEEAKGQDGEAAGEEQQVPGQREITEYLEPVATVATQATGDAMGACIHRKGFPCSLTEEQQKIPGKPGDCHASCCWECQHHAQCSMECRSSASRVEKSPEPETREPLSAYGTPRKGYPEGSLISTAGCEREPGGPQGGHNCFSCAMQCEIRQKGRYCVEAPMGSPFFCDRVDIIPELWMEMGNQCQFANPNMAYRTKGSNEPVPCCKDCRIDSCGFRCPRSVEKTGSDSEEIQDDIGGAESEQPETYDRELLEKMIAESEKQLKVMQDDWMRDAPVYYTRWAMKIRAYKNLMAEHDAAEALGVQENLEPVQPELPVLKNNDQRKEWLKDYKAWGLWYRDEHIDVNYYKFDFEDGSRLIAAEYPQRENERCKIHDQLYYHLVERGKHRYRSETTYDDKYQHYSTSETELVEYLKRIQAKKARG